MFRVDITKWAPAFLLADKNGYAIAKAIEAALQYMNDTAKTALDLVSDIDSMPEWRLDELAWEYAIPYDCDADTEAKRRMVKNAYSSYRAWGTKEGIENYLKTRFSDVSMYVYNNTYPYHFEVSLAGTCIREQDAWVKNAVLYLKNVRSVLRRISYNDERAHKLLFASSLYTSDSGTFQVGAGEALELDCYADENGDMLGDENGYPLIVEE